MSKLLCMIRCDAATGKQKDKDLNRDNGLKSEVFSKLTPQPKNQSPVTDATREAAP